MFPAQAPWNVSHNVSCLVAWDKVEALTLRLFHATDRPTFGTMADVVGVAASVLQIIQIGALVVSRIAQYSAAYGEVPEAFRHIHNRIKLLDDALRLTKEKMENDGNNGNNGTTSDAFEPILKDCLAQMTKLQSTIDIVLPKQGDSSANRKWKAIKSMKYDSEIQRLDDTIGKYMTLMSQHHVIANATQTPSSEFHEFVGVDHGTNMRSSDPKPPLKPKSTCPFERERDFVYRDTLGDIMARSKPSSKLAVIGIGGVGYVCFLWMAWNSLRSMWIYVLTCAYLESQD